MKKHAEKCINPTYVPRQLKGQPCTPVVPNWICIVPADVKFPSGARPKSAEVKFMSLSNFKGTGGALGWGGTLTWTPAEMDAINARRKDGDNINTIIVCAMDMLTGDICVWTHDVDLVMYGKYVLTPSTFHVIDPEQTGEPIPPRHRSIRQLQLWLDHISVELASPPKVVIHMHPKGVQDEHYDAMRPNYDKEIIHAYGLCCARGDPSLFHAREFLSTRASRFDKPEIGDNFSATLEGKDAVARVKAFNELFAGADNVPIGNLGEAIALDVMLMLGAQAAKKHPKPKHHYDIQYAMGPTAAASSAAPGPPAAPTAPPAVPAAPRVLSDKALGKRKKGSW